MVSRLLTAAVIAALVAATGCGGSTGPPSPPGPALGFNDDWHTFGPGSDPSRNPFALARAAGATVARYPLGWPTVGLSGSRLSGSCTQRPGNWGLYDRVYRRLTGSRACTHDPPAANAIAPLPIVVGAPPPYARTCSDDAKTPIVEDGQRADRAWEGFVENIADRYPLAKGIEVWNEPNLAPFWGDCPLDPARYARLLEFAHDGVERSTNPGIPIVLASLSPIEDGTSADWLTYLRGVFTAPGLGVPVARLFDVMGLHTYRGDQDIAAKRGFAAATIRDVELARGFLASHGAGDSPVWVTEVGVTTGGPPSDPQHVGSENEQALALRDVYAALRDLDVPVMIVHRLIDSSNPSVQAPGYGVLTAGVRKKPAYSCLAHLRGLAGSCP